MTHNDASRIIFLEFNLCMIFHDTVFSRGTQDLAMELANKVYEIRATDSKSTFIDDERYKAVSNSHGEHQEKILTILGLVADLEERIELQVKCNWDVESALLAMKSMSSVLEESIG